MLIAIILILVAVALFLIIPAMVRFSLSFAGESMQAVLGIGDFVSLLLALILASMLLFQFPLVIYILLSLGILSVETIRKKRPHAVVLIFVFAALFSPPDVASQLFLALPAWALFELSLLLFSARFKEESEEKNAPRQGKTSP